MGFFKLKRKFRTSLFWAKLSLRVIRFWPPYFGTGIRVSGYNRDLTEITVKMKLGFYNRNIVGVHFGGSLYSMCDPFFMFMMMIALGENFIVWDKAADIKFIRPGRGLVQAIFKLEAADIEMVKEHAIKNGVVEPVYEARITDEKGDLVALVHKKLYVKKKSGS